MVRADLAARGAIQDYADLAGRRIAVTGRGTFLHYVVTLALGRGGLAPTDAELVELSLPDMNLALAQGAVDAAVEAEPLATLAAERGIAVSWRGAGDIRPGWQGGGLFFGPDLLGSGAEIGRRWTVGYLRGVRDYQAALARPAGRQELAAILGRHTAVTDLALYERMAFPYLDPNLAFDATSLAEQAAWYFGQGLVPTLVAVGDVVAPEFAANAVQQLGRVADR